MGRAGKGLRGSSLVKREEIGTQWTVAHNDIRHIMMVIC